MVRALVSYQCGRGSNPGVDAICGWDFCWFSPLLRELFLRVLRFAPLLKNQHFQTQIRPRLVDEEPLCRCSTSAVLSLGTICFVRSSNFWVCRWNPVVLPFKWNLFSSTFTWYYFFVRSSNFWVCGWNPVVLPFKWNLFNNTFTPVLYVALTWCDHSSNTSSEVLSHDTIFSIFFSIILNLTFKAVFYLAISW